MSLRKNEAVWYDKYRRWQIKVQSDGERRTFTDSTPGKKGKIACEKKADKWLEERLVGENIRVEAMLDRWAERLKMSSSLSHYTQYEKYIRLYIKPQIGQKRLSKLTQADLQFVIDNAYNNPVASYKKENKEKLAKKTLINISGCLMAFMKYCRDAKATTFLPDPLTIPSGAIKREKTVAGAYDLKILFSIDTIVRRCKIVTDRYIHAYRFAVLTGMRPGELIALKWEHIKGNKIRIAGSINNYNEHTRGKNNNAQRVYVLDHHALKVLQDQRNMMNQLGEISPYVFAGRKLDFVSQSSLRKAWHRYCEINCIRNANTPYELRHTFVSVNKSMPDGLKKLIMGHSKDFDTDGVYGHEMEGDMEEASRYISSAFTKVLGW